MRHQRHRFNSWVGKILGGENDNPLQYSCLKNPMDRGAWRASVCEIGTVKELDMTERLNRECREAQAQS